MARPLILGTVLGAIVLFIWSTIAWMLIPWPGEPLRSFTNDDAVAQAIKANSPRSGNYLLPNGLATVPSAHNLRLLERYKVRVQQAREALRTR